MASPTATHLDIVREAAERGLDVVVEKPLDARLDRAEDLVALARTRGVALAVCLQHRLKPAGQALRSIVDSGVLGAFVGGSVSVPWWRPPAYYALPGRGTYARDGGGVLMTQAIHALDLFLWVAGLPVRVLAHAGRAVYGIEAEDSLVAVLDYGDGRFAPVHATVAAYPGRDEEISFAGTDGTVVVRGSALVRYTTPDGRPETVVDDEGGSTAADPGAMPTAWHRALLIDAFESFAAGREPVASGRSALVTQRVIAAAYRSARRGGWVRVDDPALSRREA